MYSPEIKIASFRFSLLNIRAVLLLAMAGLVFSACSFDYSAIAETEHDKPDLVMQDVDYVRVTDGRITFHMQADQVDRYEKKQLLQVQNVRFEQFSQDTTEPDALGTAGIAQLWTATSDANFTDGVRIVINSEDLSVEAKSLQWNNSQKKLIGSQDDQVLLKMTDGSILVGKNFSADGRSRSWQFGGPVSGTYQEESKQ